MAPKFETAALATRCPSKQCKAGKSETSGPSPRPAPTRNEVRDSARIWLAISRRALWLVRALDLLRFAVRFEAQRRTARPAECGQNRTFDGRFQFAR